MRASLPEVIKSTYWCQPHPFRRDPNFCFSGLGEGHLWDFLSLVKILLGNGGGGSVGTIRCPSPGTSALTHLASAAPRILLLSPENAEEPRVRTCGAPPLASLRLTCRSWVQHHPQILVHTQGHMHTPHSNLITPWCLSFPLCKWTYEECLPRIQ